MFVLDAVLQCDMHKTTLLAKCQIHQLDWLNMGIVSQATVSFILYVATAHEGAYPLSNVKDMSIRLNSALGLLLSKKKVRGKT